MTSCVGDLFQLLGKTHLLPRLYANPALLMIRDVSHLSDAEAAELALAKELRRLMGEKEYARQRDLGIIGGASYEQRVRWGKSEYQRQEDLGIGIAGATPEQRSKWGKLGYAAGLGTLTHEDNVKNGINGGMISGARSVELRRGVVGAKMEEWEAYFPTLEAFVAKVSYTKLFD